MVSTELMKRYPFFSLLTEEQLKAIARIAEEKTSAEEEILLQEGRPAQKLCLLIEGEVDLLFSGSGEGAVVNALVGTIAPGEVFGVSAMVEPYTYVSSVKAMSQVKYIEIDAMELRKLMEQDPSLGYKIMNNIAIAMLERLKYTQVELAAARS